MNDSHSAAHIPSGFVIKDFSTLPPKTRSTVADKVAKLERKVFPAIEHFNYDVELKKKNTGLLLVFKEDDTDKLIAYLVYQRMKRLAWLHKLCVIEQERGRGIGKALIYYLRRQMGKGGCNKIFLWTKVAGMPERCMSCAAFNSLNAVLTTTVLGGQHSSLNWSSETERIHGNSKPALSMSTIVIC